MSGNSGWVDVSSSLDHTQGATNTFRFVTINDLSGWTYGFGLREDGTVTWQDQCGQATVVGCENNDMALGTVYDHTQPL